MDLELKDMYGFPLGRIRTRRDGKLELSDMFGLFSGMYDPKSNQTTDRMGLLVGYGNLLAGLLEGNRHRS